MALGLATRFGQARPCNIAMGRKSEEHWKSKVAAQLRVFQFPAKSTICVQNSFRQACDCQSCDCHFMSRLTIWVEIVFGFFGWHIYIYIYYIILYLLCMYACMHACMYACMYVCMDGCMHVCMYACMHVCMHACMYVCMYACMHVCIYYEWQQPVAQATTVDEEVLELNCTQNCNWLPTSGKQMVAPSSLSTGIALFLFSPKLTTAFQRYRTATSTRKLW